MRNYIEQLFTAPLFVFAVVVVVVTIAVALSLKNKARIFGYFQNISGCQTFQQVFFQHSAVLRYSSSVRFIIIAPIASVIL